MGTRFSARPDRPWGPPSLLYNGYRVFPGGKVRPGRDADPSPLLVPWSRKSRAIPLLLLWAVRPVQSLSACTRVHFTLPFPSSWQSKIYATNIETVTNNSTITLKMYVENSCETDTLPINTASYSMTVIFIYTTVPRDGSATEKHIVMNMKFLVFCHEDGGTRSLRNSGTSRPKIQQFSLK